MVTTNQEKVANKERNVESDLKRSESWSSAGRSCQSYPLGAELARVILTSRRSPTLPHGRLGNLRTSQHHTVA